MIISQDPPDSSDIPSPDVRQHSRPNSKLIAEVKQITQRYENKKKKSSLLVAGCTLFNSQLDFSSDSISKKGYLMYQENAVEDKWVKKWFVVRR